MENNLFPSIICFAGNDRFLSNFYPSPFVDKNGISWKTVEHFYQAHKAKEYEDVIKIRNCKTPGQAKRLGSNINLVDNWNKIKLDVMFSGLEYKFTQNENLKEKLIKTKGIDLIEGNTWGDTFWGFDINQNKGYNFLGKMLMTLRDRIDEGLYD